MAILLIFPQTHYLKKAIFAVINTLYIYEEIFIRNINMAHSLIKFEESGRGKRYYAYEMYPNHECKFGSKIDKNAINKEKNRGSDRFILNTYSKKTLSIMDKMYDNIAKDDGFISSDEMQAYFDRLEEAAKKNDAKDVLDDNELYEFCEDIGIVRKRKFRKFIYKLFGWTDQKREEEKFVMRKTLGYIVVASDIKRYEEDYERLKADAEKAKKAKEEAKKAEKAKKEAEIEARTTYDKQGNKVYTDENGYRTVYDKDIRDKSVTYDDKNRVVASTYRMDDAIITDKTFYVADKKNPDAKRSELITYDNGRSEETFYDDKGRKISFYVHDKDNNWESTRYYDKKGREISGFAREKGKITKRFEKQYDKNGTLRRLEIEHCNKNEQPEKNEIWLYDEAGFEINYYTRKP